MILTRFKLMLYLWSNRIQWKATTLCYLLSVRLGPLTTYKCIFVDLANSIGANYSRQITQLVHLIHKRHIIILAPLQCEIVSDYRFSVRLYLLVIYINSMNIIHRLNKKKVQLAICAINKWVKKKLWFVFSTYSMRSFERCWKSVSKITVMLLPCKSLQETKKRNDLVSKTKYK